METLPSTSSEELQTALASATGKVIAPDGVLPPDALALAGDAARAWREARSCFLLHASGLTPKGIARRTRNNRTPLTTDLVVDRIRFYRALALRWDPRLQLPFLLHSALSTLEKVQLLQPKSHSKASTHKSPTAPEPTHQATAPPAPRSDLPESIRRRLSAAAS